MMMIIVMITIITNSNNDKPINYKLIYNTVNHLQTNIIIVLCTFNMQLIHKHIKQYANYNTYSHMYT